MLSRNASHVEDVAATSKIFQVTIKLRLRTEPIELGSQRLVGRHSQLSKEVFEDFAIVL